MLKCVDDSYYVGVTNSIERRLYEHKTGYNPGSYTSKRLPFKLVYYTTFRYIQDAISWEKQLKDWSRAKKEALIKRDWERVRKYSECRNKSHSKNYRK